MKIIRVEETKDKEAWSLFQKVYETIDNKEYFAFDKNYIPPKLGYTYKLYEGNKLAACFLLTFSPTTTAIAYLCGWIET